MKKLFIILLVCSSFSFAQEHKHGLGFAAGQISGLGISYRNESDLWAWQLTFGAISNKDDYTIDWNQEKIYAPVDEGHWWPESNWMQHKGGRNTFGNIGLNVYRYLHKGERSSFYTMGGMSMFFDSEIRHYKQYSYERIDDNYIQQVESNNEKTETETEYDYFFGIGIGIEFVVFDNIRIAFELPLTFSSNGDFYMYIPQAGIHYMF